MSSHGTFVMELPATTPPVATIASAVIGIICTADDADAAVFPANTAVLLTNPRSGTASAGTTGTLLNTLTAIGNQTNAQVVVVRVPEGADTAETETNLIGGDVDGKKTGMQALLSAQSKLGVKPRILGAPGLDTQAVTTALVTVAQKLRAFVYAGCNGCNTKAAAIAYRANFTARELMLIWPEFINDSGSVMPATAYALGSRAQIDNDIGWHKTLSNVAVDGVAGISADVYWDLMDPDCDAVQLNEAGITTLVGRKTGRRGGRDIVSYSFWGNRTCAAEPQFEFENYTRSAHKITEAVLESVFGDLDKPLNQARPQAILERLHARLRGMVHDGHLVGANVWQTNVKGGVTNHPTFMFDFTPIPPLEYLQLNQRIIGVIGNTVTYPLFDDELGYFINEYWPNLIKWSEDIAQWSTYRTANSSGYLVDGRTCGKIESIYGGVCNSARNFASTDTLSGYARATAIVHAGNTDCILMGHKTVSGWIDVRFNLATATLLTNWSATIKSLGNGWFEISVLMPQSGDRNGVVFLGPLRSSNVGSARAGDYVYIHSLMVSHGEGYPDYIKTEDTAGRFSDTLEAF